MTALGVKPEIEAFDTGHLLVRKAACCRWYFWKPDALVQLCMGVPWGAPDDLNTFYGDGKTTFQIIGPFLLLDWVETKCHMLLQAYWQVGM